MNPPVYAEPLAKYTKSPGANACEFTAASDFQGRCFVPPPEWSDVPATPADRFGAAGEARAPSGAASAAADSLPADFPSIQASIYGNPTPGRLFLADLDERGLSTPSYLMILENDGTPYFHRRLDAAGIDFKQQPDGRLTYFDYARRAFYALDSTYAVVDSFRCGNGYDTDSHDLLLLPTGHALLMSYDPEIVDMSQIIPKGRPDATVVGLIVQELDRNKNVVFQWRSWDHFQITDAIGVPLSGFFIDYVHGNSLDADSLGNILLSSRHLSEVTKIDRQTGDILWRLGGKNNQFRFVDDPIGFSYQHDARFLPDGHITLFDNGNFHTPPFSRAVEYEIDEPRMTAKLVWDYRHDPDVFGFATGSVERLFNGNTLICWGFTTPTLTEVTRDRKVVMELSFRPGVASYRGLRFEWPPMKSAIVDLSPKTLNLGGGQGWITATIESNEFDVSDVIVPSVRLDGAVPADPASASYGDSNGNGSRDLTLRFGGDATASLLGAGVNRVEVSGDLATGGRFHGFAPLDVLASTTATGGAPALRLASRPGAVPVLLDLDGSPARVRTLAVYDVRGRLVKRWRAVAGRGARAAWDGYGSGGWRAGPGVYFVRVEETAGSGRAAKVIVLR